MAELLVFALGCAFAIALAMVLLKLFFGLLFSPKKIG